jgi:hypothetical protein
LLVSLATGLVFILDLKLDVEVLNQFLVSVADGDLGHACYLGNLALGPALAAQNTSDVDD